MSKMEDLYCKLSSSIREIKACHWFCIPFLSHSLQKKAISSYAISLGPRKHNIWPSSYKARLLQHTELSEDLSLASHTKIRGKVAMSSTPNYLPNMASQFPM